MIWALRRYAGCRLSPEARTAVLAPAFSRAFGVARLEETLCLFSRLADGLTNAARLPPALSALEDDRINATEEALLASLATLQQGAVAQARALGEWILLPPGRAAFFAAAERLALIMREAGQRLPYQPPQRPTLQTQPADDVLPSAVGMADLLMGERAVVMAMRARVTAFRAQEDAVKAARSVFTDHFHGEGRLWGDRRRGDDVGLGLHVVLRNTTLAATRSVHLRLPACPGRSPDKARILEAVAWPQHDIAPPAETALGDWLPPAAVRLTMRALRGLALALLTAELPLPRRTWDFVALAEADHPLPEEPSETGAQPLRLRPAPTVH